MSGPIPSTGNLIDVYRPVDASGFDLQATPEAPVGISMQPQKNGCGTGSFSLPVDDSAYPDIAVNDVVAIRHDGNTVFAFVIEDIGEHTLDEGEGSRLLVTYAGRGVGVFLDWILIYPDYGDETKPVQYDTVLDWRSPRWTDFFSDGWVPATEIMSVATAQGGAWPHQPMAEDFNLSYDAQMLWASSGDDEYAPAGWCLFFRDIEITVPGRYAIELLMDDKGKFWVDGIEMVDVAAEDGFVRASYKRIDFTAGWHHLTFAVFNFEDPDNPGDGLGPAALAFNFYKADAQGHYLEDGLLVISDADTYVLAYPDPWPGMTVGEDLITFVSEGQARGTAEWLVPSFDQEISTDVAYWDQVSVSTKTGKTTLLQFMDELTAAGRISQWRVLNDGMTFEVRAPGYTERPSFDGYPDGYELTPAPVDDPRSGQLVQLDRRIT